MFSMVPTLHCIRHLGDRAQRVNPRKACCLLDEDYVGQTKSVVTACAHDTALRVIQPEVAEQYRFGLFFTMRFGV